ncbi:PQQ-binding-like beta-propeller repeat protein [Actinoplanes sp. NPDC049118]|uniref:outer membrane protein assembly factor BamB family protein n=1 Tax=Actinoplanes sp. NPDC049118 TaxID=3155769 RepID=UPI0033CE752F
MRLPRFERNALRTAARRLLTLGTAAAIAATAGVAPARAVSSSPADAPLFNGSVYAIAYRGDAVYVGGSFTSVGWGGRSYARQRLAAFDVASGALLDWAPSADGTVRALAVNGTSVYAGGGFHRIAGIRRDGLARLDASTGEVGAFSHVMTGSPYALSIAGGRLYVGGSFDSVDGRYRGNLAAFRLEDGALDTRWRPSADDSVHALATKGAHVYAGGAFHMISGIEGTMRIAALHAQTGAVYLPFRPNAPAQVNALTTDEKGVYAATGGQGGRAIAYSDVGAVRWSRLFDGDAVAITSLRGTVFVGGHFDRACLTNRNGLHGACTDGGVDRVKLAAIDGRGALTGWAPKGNGVIGVRVLAVDRDRATVAAGGDFTTINGEPRKRFAYFS